MLPPKKMFIKDQNKEAKNQGEQITLTYLI